MFSHYLTHWFANCMYNLYLFGCSSLQHVVFENEEHVYISSFNTSSFYWRKISDCIKWFYNV